MAMLNAIEVAKYCVTSRCSENYLVARSFAEWQCKVCLMAVAGKSAALFKLLSNNKENKMILGRPQKLKIAGLSDVRNSNNVAIEKHLTDNETRNNYIRWFYSLPVKYHLTLTFPFGISEKQCVKSLNDILHKLNLKLFNRAYSRGSAFLSGVAVMEDTGEMDNVHFHIMILDNERIQDKGEFSRRIRRLVDSPNTLVDEYKLQDHYVSPYTSLEKYLTKVFEIYSMEVAMDRIGYLSLHGVEFGDGKQLSSRVGSYLQLPKTLSAMA